MQGAVLLHVTRRDLCALQILALTFGIAALAHRVNAQPCVARDVCFFRVLALSQSQPFLLFRNLSHLDGTIKDRRSASLYFVVLFLCPHGRFLGSGDTFHQLGVSEVGNVLLLTRTLEVEILNILLTRCLLSFW